MISTEEWGGQRKESVNWKTDQQKLPNLKQQRENALNNINSASVTYGTITKDRTQCYQSPGRKGEKGQDFKST